MSKSLLADIPVILQKLHSSDRIVLALDFDGTLAPIVDRPEQAALPPGTAAVLRELAAWERISIAILSGRSIADLKSKIDFYCIQVGNHGLEIEGQGISFVHEDARELRHAIDLACADLESALAGVYGVFIEDKGLTATVHHRMAPEHLVGWIDATIDTVMRPYAHWLGVNPARKAWEIRPRVDWNKGTALSFVLDRMGSVNPLLICAGDDVTDEDMFRVLPDAISVQVGGRTPTVARYRVDGPAGLVEFLEEIALANRAGRETPHVC